MNDVKFTGYDSVFATRLRELMSGNGTTQKDLAGVTGITRQAISQYMDGSVQPNIEKLYKICDFFKVSADYLLGLSSVKSFDIEEKAIGEKTGLSESAIEKLLGLNRVKNIKMKIKRKDLDEATYKLKKSINPSEIDVIMNSKAEDDLFFPFMLNKFIEADKFYILLGYYAKYALDHTLLKDYEKWANEYLDNNLTDEIVKNAIGYNIESLEGSNDEKNEAMKLVHERFYSMITKELFKIDLNNGDLELLSYVFFKRVQKIMVTIVESIENEARNTKVNQLRFLQVTQKFDEVFRSRKFKLVDDLQFNEDDGPL
ncbi:MAG: hypothetical protein BI182_16935 [Acetobacterium sp. MES1]|uniref:helix-turn-helix domain-containing protein n=1 Tax=Acetobacterium sp. MES1 TaxID=1899015 RepID=UPI000B9CB3E9|nr:helix-turn-helix transcriptional regulator [Acetobacterium sp. MES1]OXS24693.1 MAG: hypothetical protein BI182_16935 [Acetobacterium sp. MES1]